MRWLLAFLLCIPAFGQDFASVAVVGNLFHPREIAGINAHWDASTLQGANGTTVRNWVDSVNGISASNVVVSTCPQLVYTNGAKALRFDGVDDYLNAGTSTINLITNTWSMYCVGSMSSAANQTLYGKTYSGAGGGRYFIVKESNIEFGYDLSVGNGIKAATWSPGGVFIVENYFNRGYGYGFKTNNVFAAENADALFTTSYNSVNANKFVFGAYPDSSQTSYVWPLNGLICEFIAIKRNGSNWVSSVESGKINEYFQNKYKLQRISRL